VRLYPLIDLVDQAPKTEELDLQHPAVSEQKQREGPAPGPQLPTFMEFFTVRRHFPKEKKSQGERAKRGEGNLRNTPKARSHKRSWERGTPSENFEIRIPQGPQRGVSVTGEK